jgi:hypothetical protein
MDGTVPLVTTVNSMSSEEGKTSEVVLNHGILMEPITQTDEPTTQGLGCIMGCNSPDETNNTNATTITTSGPQKAKKQLNPYKSQVPRGNLCTQPDEPSTQGFGYSECFNVDSGQARSGSGSGSNRGSEDIQRKKRKVEAHLTNITVQATDVSQPNEASNTNQSSAALTGYITKYVLTNDTAETSCPITTNKTDTFGPRESKNNNTITSATITPQKPKKHHNPYKTQRSADKTLSETKSSIRCNVCKKEWNTAKMEHYFRCPDVGCKNEMEDLWRDDLFNHDPILSVPPITDEQSLTFTLLSREFQTITDDIKTRKRIDKDMINKFWQMKHVAVKNGLLPDDKHVPNPLKHSQLRNTMNNCLVALEIQNRTSFQQEFYTMMYLLLVGYSHV